MQIYTVAEVAKILKCSAHTVRNLILGGSLLANNITPYSAKGTFRVTQSQLDLFLETLSPPNGSVHQVAADAA